MLQCLSMGISDIIIPKKDGSVHWVSDFRELNKVIQRRIYPLPRIHDILKRCSGYSFFSKLDVSMQYFTFKLDADSQKKLCVISTPFGLYKFKRLPMGIKQSSDIAQEVIGNLFQDLDNVEIYIDNIGCFSSSFANHIYTFDII